MAIYDIAVPLIALGLGGLAVAYAKWLNRRLHSQDDRTIFPAE